MAPASIPSAMSQRSASLSLSAILLARSTVLEKAASKVSAIGSMGRSIGIGTVNRNASLPLRSRLCSTLPRFGALLEPHGVDPYMSRALFAAAKQRDIRYMPHIHEALMRCAP